MNSNFTINSSHKPVCTQGLLIEWGGSISKWFKPNLCKISKCETWVKCSPCSFSLHGQRATARWRQRMWPTGLGSVHQNGRPVVERAEERLPDVGRRHRQRLQVRNVAAFHVDAAEPLENLLHSLFVRLAPRELILKRLPSRETLSHAPKVIENDNFHSPYNTRSKKQVVLKTRKS